MNFKEAYEKMQEGKKVRRAVWEKYKYYSLIEDDIYFVGKIIVQCVTIEDSLAEDWETFEEPKIKDWEPKKGDKYYYINDAGSIFNYDCREDISDEAHLNIGNYFKTEEDAKHMVEKLKVIRKLQKFAYENNEKEINWNNEKQSKFFLYFDYYLKRVRISSCINWIYLPFNIYFNSEEIAKKAIDTIGEERIKKYYFDVEE